LDPAPLKVKVISMSEKIRQKPTIDETKLKPIRDRNRERGLILKELRNRSPLTIEELSEATNLPKTRVLDHIIALRQLGRVATVGEKGDWFLYALSEIKEVEKEDTT